MTTYERQLSAIQMLSGIDSKKSADVIDKIWAFINDMVNVKTQKKKNAVASQTDDEWTEEQEREAFLYTSKVNAAKIFAKYL
ncbi:MAG: hypothetical protein J6T96_07385 [Bacteroidales bacterium]|nr:hypothetical protein [Bacteroidales bacterium]